MARRKIALFIGMLVSVFTLAGVLPASAATGSLSQTGAVLSESAAEAGSSPLGADTAQSHLTFTASQTCSARGGANGFGFARITAKQFENGVSGTRQFRQIARGQVFSGGRWRTVASRTVVSRVFPNDARSFSFGPVTHQYNFEPRFNGLFARVQVKMDWIGNFGLVGTRTINSCAAEV